MQVVRHVEGVEEETEKVEAKAMVEGEDSIWEGPGFAAELWQIHNNIHASKPVYLALLPFAFQWTISNRRKWMPCNYTRLRDKWRWWWWAPVLGNGPIAHLKVRNLAVNHPRRKLFEREMPIVCSRDKSRTTCPETNFFSFSIHKNLSSFFFFFFFLLNFLFVFFFGSFRTLKMIVRDFLWIYVLCVLSKIFWQTVIKLKRI